MPVTGRERKDIFNEKIASNLLDWLENKQLMTSTMKRKNPHTHTQNEWRQKES